MIEAPPRLLDPGRRGARAWQAGAIAVALLGARLANPDRPLPFDVCAFKHLTGRPCPTCGLTRAVCHAVRGDWAQSVAYHPAGPLVALALVAWMVWSAAEAYRGQPLEEALRGRLGNALLAAGAVLSLAAWVVRLTTGV
jgi:Protein of unknown function (DUF2752)